MPTHKHKKNKKSHKHRSKYSSTFLHKILMQSEKLPVSDSESSENDDILTCLVRRSYTNHLQEALVENFKISIDSSAGLKSVSIEEMVDKWSSALEKKALQACMIKEKYRKNMVSLIKHIKAATDDRKLCFEEQNVCTFISTLPKNIETQTENMISDTKMVTIETQTDCTMTSFSKQNSYTLRSSQYDSAADLNIGCVGSSQPWEKSGSNQDVCSITSTSDLYPPLITDSSVNINDNTVNKNSLCGLSLDVNAIKYDNSCSLTDDTIPEKRNCLDTPKYNSNSGRTFDEIGDYCQQFQETSIVDSRHSFGSSKFEINTQHKFNFNISAVESDFDFENNLKQLASWKFKKSNWYAEETAQMCNLTRILLRMSTSRRERVVEKIKNLFGDSEIPLAELTVENITICRKRIASAVVMELTPIYKSKRIASRKLFKYLAKKITKSIMEQSYAPGVYRTPTGHLNEALDLLSAAIEESKAENYPTIIMGDINVDSLSYKDTRIVRWKVREFFSDGKTITNESDCK